MLSSTGVPRLRNGSFTRLRVLTTLVWAAALVAAPTAARAQADGPVAAYAFSESSGVVATDSSSAGNSPASLQGASHVPGRFGSGLQLDGLDDAVQLPV